MTTAVQSPPGFQSLRLGWNAGSTSAGGFSAMSSDEPNRAFMQPRKQVTRSSSSSSLASNGSTSSTTTVVPSEASSSSQANNESSNASAKKKPRGGFWPVSKAESTSGVSNARANGAVQTTNTSAANGLASKNALQPAVPSQNHTNGTRNVPSQPGGMEQAAILALLPMNGTFERKQINVPFFPEILKIGRQTNAKTVPTPVNGFFDSKVLSRQHAEIWAERNGKIWIRDVKSSNGTFVNGQRLSPENRESEPHELRQHDTLELGIDIVSEDQKTIVHHKVSAKVEFAGLPGNSNNVLDLNFGDLDPSHGGPLLASPMSQPMVQSRSRPGGPPNGRVTTSTNVAGAQMTSAVQQRQANFWGTPLNIEQLVKQLSTEMRVAKQQAQDLNHVHTFLNSMMAPEGSPSKLQPPPSELSAPRQPNGRTKAPRVDHPTRFGDPPAPPPQQPLPEKPDSAKSSPISTMPMTNALKRSDTTKAQTNGVAQSPTGPQSGQILSLVNALEIAKKELDSQNSHIKQLEDMLKQERSAREAAEERARKIEEVASAKPVSNVESEENTVNGETNADDSTIHETPSSSSTHNEVLLQQQIDSMVAEMQRMKEDVEQAHKRAETAEKDAISSRVSLAEMIERIKKENEASSDIDDALPLSKNADQAGSAESTEKEEGVLVRRRENGKMANGHVRNPSRLPQAVESLMATVMRENPNGDITAQSAPYVSMVGVVLIGVGLMAYLNSWQKGDK